MNRSHLSLFLITAVTILILFMLPPIPQWLSYHQFADLREVWGIPNFWNVVSNIPFFLVGVWGFLAIKQQWLAGNFVSWQEVAPFFVIFLGLVFTSIGSSYYHLAPDNYRLVWDRLPMTLGFMAFVSIAVMERIHFKCGFWLLLLFILCGIGSVWYWFWTESLGHGDLRPYGFVQFYSLVVILIILYLFPKPYPSTKSFLMPILFYGIALVFGFMDKQIYQIGEIISGHTLKHLFAAFGAYWFVVMVNELKLRRSQGTKQTI